MKGIQINVPKPTILPSGMYRIQLRINGKSISITNENEKQCIEEAIQIKKGYKEDSRTPIQHRSLEAILEKYIEDNRAVLSPSTIRGYDCIKRTRFESIRCRPVSSLTEKDYQRAIIIELKSVSPKTVRNAWGFVASALREECGINVQPKIQWQMPKADKNYLQPEQIPQFLKAIKGHKFEIAFLLGLHGLRASEVLDIQKKDIDLKKRIIHIRGAAVRDETGQLVHKQTNKNESSRRDVPIMIDRLTELVKESGTAEDDYLVQAYNSNTIHHAVNALCEHEGLPLLGTHGLRHTFASMCYHQGLQAKITMKLGGWSDDKTMLRIYTHFANSDLHEGVKQLSDFYNNAGKETDSKKKHKNHLKRLA